MKKYIKQHTQEQPLVIEHRGGTHSRQKRPQPQPPHARGTFYRHLLLLYMEKYKVSCCGFLPKTKSIQHSYSHYNTFRRIMWLVHIFLCIWYYQITIILQPLQPQIQETYRTTHAGITTRYRIQRKESIRDRNDRSSNRRTHEVPFIAGCNHFIRKNIRFRAPASFPKKIH